MIVVKVHTAAINPCDYKVHSGFTDKVLGWTMPLPFTAGYDFAGVVDSVHQSDLENGFEVGERVFAVNWGTSAHQDEGTPAGGAFADYILIPANKLSKIPHGVTYDQAAAVALVGTTAYQILFDCAKVKKGQRVLILGGATSVGQVAVQLAKDAGAWVATTASSRNLEFVAQFGADLIVNYNNEKWEEIGQLKNLDAVLDTIGEEGGFARSVDNNVVKSSGAFVSIANVEAGTDPTAHAPMHYAAFYVLKNSAAVQDVLANKIAAGTLKITIDEAFPFTTEGVQDLFRKVMSNTSNGKNLLRVE